MGDYTNYHVLVEYLFTNNRAGLSEKHIGVYQIPNDGPNTFLSDTEVVQRALQKAGRNSRRSKLRVLAFGYGSDPLHTVVSDGYRRAGRFQL